MIESVEPKHTPAPVDDILWKHMEEAIEASRRAAYPEVLDTITTPQGIIDEKLATDALKRFMNAKDSKPLPGNLGN